MYLFLVIFSISVKAQDTLTVEAFDKMLNSQSEICRDTFAIGLSTYCVLHKQPKYIAGYCGTVHMENPNKITEESNAFLGRLLLACANTTEEEFAEKTNSEKRALFTSFAGCVQPIISEAVEEYGCYAFDYPQSFELLTDRKSYLFRMELEGE